VLPRGVIAFTRRSWETLGFSIQNIGRTKLRSALTILGVVLGVASVIVMLAVGEGARLAAIEQIRGLGAENIIIRSVKPLSGSESEEGAPLVYGLTDDDLGRIATTIPTVTRVIPIREHREDVYHLDRAMEGRVVAVTAGYQDLNGIRMQSGRFITELDHSRVSTVAVLAAETARALFPMVNPIGRSVRIGEDQYYEVVGVAEPRATAAGVEGSLPPEEFSRDVYIPFGTDRARFGEVLTRTRAGVSEKEKIEISRLTVTVRGVEDVNATSEIVRGLVERFHPAGDASLTVPLQLLEKVEATQRIFTLVIGAIAAISLLVGGIGIMNIMLASVTERTREVGILRAIGARRSDIVWQFLLETMVLSGAGGVLGLILGVFLTFIVTYSFGMQAVMRSWSLGLAFTISVAVGLIFGTYPARRAAHMNPIEALRHE
jgi:putative ABC transport system permease protein